jgi:hypothetical protein
VRIASVLLAICCSLSGVSAKRSATLTVLPDEIPVRVGTGAAARPAVPSGLPLDISIGSLDTIGGTFSDQLFQGPVWRMIVGTRRHGINAVWTRTYDTLYDPPNMRYQFYDSLSGLWNWDDPNRMLSGVSVFSPAAGYGNADIDTSGYAVISAKMLFGTSSQVAYDIYMGAGIFTQSADLDGYVWPCVGVNMNDYYQLAVVDRASQNNLYWSRSTDEGTSWEPAEYVATPQFPTHNIATSKVPGSNKVCMTWVESPASGYEQEPGFYRESTDGGGSWNSPTDIGFPPAFHPNSDTVLSFHVASLFPFYDCDDRLNIVAGVQPYLNDTNLVNPSEIWHYCPDNTPQWNRIHRAGCDPANLQASVGQNATYACRPSIGQDDYGDLFVTWEQFDSANVETTTTCLRADVWVSGSTDGGRTWSDGRKLTMPGTATCRFPSICDRPWLGDSLAVLYEVDQCAGFYQLSQGPPTENPMVVQRVPMDSIVERGEYYGRLRQPNGGEFLLAGDSFTIKWTVAPLTFHHGVLSLSTDGGSTFPAVIKDSIAPRDTAYRWGPIPALCCSLCRVKYEAKDSAGATVFSDMSYGVFTIDTVLSAVSEGRSGPGIAARALPTVIRGVLLLAEAASRRPQSANLLDVTGRNVMYMKPGANDVRGLPPGVYFLLVQPEAASPKTQEVQKIVIAR